MKIDIMAQRRFPAAKLTIMPRIDAPPFTYPFAGRRILHHRLSCVGVSVVRALVTTLMRRMRIEAIDPRPHRSKPLS